MASVVVRPATRADGPLLGQLGAMLMRVHYDFDRDRFMNPGTDPAQGYAEFLLEQLDDPDAAVLVAEQDAIVVGYVYVAIEPRSWKELRERAGFVHDLAVDPDQRRGGVGTALADAAVVWLRERSIPQVVLWTSTANLRAQTLFARLGFRQTMIEMTRTV